MRVVAAGDLYWSFERTKRYLSEIGEGIVLFAEGSLSEDKHDPPEWTVEDIAKYTKDFPMTIVGERAGRIHIVKKGRVVPAQFADAYTQPEWQYAQADKLHNVSYENGRRVLALSRICADGSTPYNGNGKADLLLIASGGIDWEENLDEILEAHERSLKPNSLIMQCDHHRGNRFIYSLKDRRMIGREVIGEQGDKYIVHEM